MKVNGIDRNLGGAFFGSLLLVSRALFWFGVLWCLLGSIMTFVPGGEQSWFTIATALVAFGVLIPHRVYRIAAIALVLLTIYVAFEGRLRGIEYRRIMETSNAGQRQRIP